MNDCHLYALIGALLALIVAWVLAIASGSMMAHQSRTENWRKDIAGNQAKSNVQLRQMTESWQQKPFVSLKAFDAKDTLTCPPDFPEDVIYDMWPGSTMACDCLRYEKDRTLRLDQDCEEDNMDKSKRNSGECHEIGGMAPQVLNILNGVRYCGRRGELAFKDFQRPVKVNDGYECPSGFNACNEEFFKNGGEDYVICYPDSAYSSQVCPITGIAFDIAKLSNKDLYEWQPIVSYVNKDTRGVYFSRKVMQHGIERVTVQSDQPCLDPLQYGAADNQQFYFAELRRKQRSCTKLDYTFTQLRGSMAKMNEYDFHLENGLLNKVDAARSSTYSFFPSSEAVKKDVELNVYQRPIVNYKLECAADPERTIQKILEDLEKGIDESEMMWPKLINDMRFGAPSLFVIIMAPILSGAGTIVCTPLAFITVGVLFGLTLKNAIPVSEELERYSDFETDFSWVQDCVDIDYNFSQDTGSKKEIEAIAGSVSSLASLIIGMYACLGSILLIAIMVGIFECCRECERVSGNLSTAYQEACQFTKAYLFFN